MRPMGGGTCARSVSSRSQTAHHKRPTTSQVFPEAVQGTLPGRSQDTLAPSLADYCEPYHCDPPREDPRELLLRMLQHEVLLGTW